MKQERTLSEQLEWWRIERPDEWQMDEFVRESKKLERELAENIQMSGKHILCVGRFDVKSGVTLNDVVYYRTHLADGSYELFAKLGE